MSAVTLISGTLHGAPVERVARGGAAFVTAKVRVGAGPDAEWWSAVCFSKQGVAELVRLGDGDAVAMLGHATFNTYNHEGLLRLNRQLRADRVLGLGLALSGVEGAPAAGEAEGEVEEAAA